MTQHQVIARQRPRSWRALLHRAACLAGILGLVGATMLASPVTAASRSDSSAPLPVPYSLLAGEAASLSAPGASPPGAGDYSCRPTRAHPRPVVLLHGFAANMTNSWATAAPLLHNNGYCVFALTYGKLARVDPTGTFGGLDHIATSAKELAAFVDRVLAATGAAKVDIVGWSEGGWLGRQYIQFNGGAKKVDRYVGLAPANGPTNVSQVLFAFGALSPAAAAFGHRFATGVASVLPLAGEAADAELFAELNAGGGTSPSVVYTNIATRYDELVPPAVAFIPTGAHVTNIVVQDGCPLDFSDHLSLVAARRAMGFMLNALDPTRTTPPPCVLTLPLAG